MSDTVRIEHWEADQYIIRVNGVACGCTLPMKDAKVVLPWLASALPEIIKNEKYDSEKKSEKLLAKWIRSL